MAYGREYIAVYKPGENVPVYATGANIDAGHFVSLAGKNTKGAYIGAHTGAGLASFGVSERDAIAGKTDHRGGTNVVRRGAIARVVAGAAIDASAGVVAVKSDATGRAIPQAGTGIILGYAVSTVTAAGQIVEVDLS